MVEMEESWNLQVWGQLGAEAWWADMVVGLCVEQECLAWVCRVIAVIIPILSDQVVSSCREN